MVVLRNLSGRDIILEPLTEVGMLMAANRGPSIQIPDEQELKENEKKIQWKSSQADLSEGNIQQEETDPEVIFQKSDVLGLQIGIP